jgi:hypothetical protein
MADLEQKITKFTREDRLKPGETKSRQRTRSAPGVQVNTPDRIFQLFHPSTLSSFFLASSSVFVALGFGDHVAALIAHQLSYRSELFMTPSILPFPTHSRSVSALTHSNQCGR